MYLGNRYVTFGLSHDGAAAAYVRYLAVGAVVAGLAAVLLAAFVEGAGLDPRPAQALALILLAPLSFVLSKRFAFGLRASGGGNLHASSRPPPRAPGRALRRGVAPRGGLRWPRG